MQRYAIVNADGEVETVVESDIEAVPWPGCTVVACDDITGAGDTFDGKTFTRPIPTEVPADATVGQLVDIALQLGILEPTAVFALLPIADDTPTKVDADGAIVVDASTIEVLVSDALTKGTVEPVDGTVEVVAMDAPIDVTKEA